MSESALGSGAGLYISSALLLRVETYANRRLPLESGGLLTGRRVGDAVLATAFAGLANVLLAADRFGAGGAETVQAVMQAALRAEVVVATMHSHPGENGLPSARDLRAAYGYASCLHAIVSYPRGRFAFRVFRYWKNGAEYFCAEVPVFVDESSRRSASP